MKTKIAILHASNTKNYGSLMMVTNLIYYIDSIAKDKYDFYVDNEESDGIERIQKETTLTNIYRLSDMGITLYPKYNQKSKIEKLRKYIQHSFGMYKKYEKAGFSKVIYLGGDDFSEDYNLKGLVLEFIKLYQFNRHNIQTILVGQTIGPFYSWRKTLASMSFKKSVIYTRDNISLEYLKDELQLDETKIFRMKDLALLELPRQKSLNIKSVLEKYKLTTDEYIVSVPSGIWKNYCDSQESYLREWKEIIIALHKLTDKKIVLLTHVSKDTEVIEALYQLLTDEEKQQIIKITNLLLPSEARLIIGNANFIVTGRMHASVSAVQTITPFVVLSYSIKYKGVIGELGLGEQIVEATPEKWNNNVLSTEVIEKVKRLLDNSTEIKNSITTINSLNDEEVLKTIKQITSYLEV